MYMSQDIKEYVFDSCIHYNDTNFTLTVLYHDTPNFVVTNLFYSFIKLLCSQFPDVRYRAEVCVSPKRHAIDGYCILHDSFSIASHILEGYQVPVCDTSYNDNIIIDYLNKEPMSYIKRALKAKLQQLQGYKLSVVSKRPLDLPNIEVCEKHSNCYYYILSPKSNDEFADMVLQLNELDCVDKERLIGQLPMSLISDEMITNDYHIKRKSIFKDYTFYTAKVYCNSKKLVKLLHSLKFIPLFSASVYMLKSIPWLSCFFNPNTLDVVYIIQHQNDSSVSTTSKLLYQLLQVSSL